MSCAVAVAIVLNSQIVGSPTFSHELGRWDWRGRGGDRREVTIIIFLFVNFFADWRRSNGQEIFTLTFINSVFCIIGGSRFDPGANQIQQCTFVCPSGKKSRSEYLNHLMWRKNTSGLCPSSGAHKQSFAVDNWRRVRRWSDYHGKICNYSNYSW